MVEKISNGMVWFHGPRNNKQNSRYTGVVEFLPGGFVHLKRKGLILPSHRVIEIIDKDIADEE